MEVTIKNTSSRILLERADNGVILYDISEDNSVSSKVLYEVYYKDGIIDFYNIGVLIEIMESLKVPIAEEETNRRMLITITKIDPNKPMIDIDGLDEDDEDDDDDE
jgi:hypothetical protein